MSEKHMQAIPEIDRPDQRERNIACRRACDEAGIPTEGLKDGALVEVVAAVTALLAINDEFAEIYGDRTINGAVTRDRARVYLAKLKGE